MRTSLSLLPLLAAMATACSAEPGGTTGPEDNLTGSSDMTTNVLRSSYTREPRLNVWGDRLVVTNVDMVQLFDGGQAWQYQQADGPPLIREVKASAMTTFPVGDGFKKIDIGSRVDSAAVGGSKLFLLGYEDYINRHVYRVDAPGETPVKIVTSSAEAIAADDQYVYTMEFELDGTAAGPDAKMVRRKHDGSDKKVLGTVPSSFSSYDAHSFVAKDGYAYIKNKWKTDKTIYGFGPDGTAITITGLHSDRASFAIHGDSLYIADYDQILRAKLGSSTTVVFKDEATLNADVSVWSSEEQTSSYGCGIHRKSGGGAAFSVDDTGVHIFCDPYDADNGDHYIHYAFDGSTLGKAYAGMSGLPGRFQRIDGRVCFLNEFGYQVGEPVREAEIRCVKTDAQGNVFSDDE